jgi:ATP-dependent Clp protease ATP-binding subunit ClpA
MFERFTSDARTVVKAAETNARGLGSPTVEAEHLLLALASHTPPVTPLEQAGLDHDAVLAALDHARERSLMAVGLAAGDFDLPPAPVTRHPRFAASAKTALALAVKASAARHDRHIAAGHVLLGVLAAEAGTVPRALAAAGVDPGELRASTTAWLYSAGRWGWK